MSKLAKDEDDLAKLADDCLLESDPQTKGELLERFFESVLSREGHFEIVNKHVRTETGELDYVLRHSLTDPFWCRSQHVVVECKNWKRPIGPEQLDHFLELVEKSGPLCNVGVYVTTSRLTKAARTTIRDKRLVVGIIAVIVEKDCVRKLALGLRGLIPRLYEKQTY